MSVAVNIAVGLSVAVAVAAPFLGFWSGRRGLRIAFWAILAAYAIHLAVAWSLADPADTLIGFGIASLLCLGGFLSVFLSALGVIWADRRTAAQSGE